MTLLPPWIPDDVRSCIDLDEFAEWDADIAAARDQIEAELDQHVAVYREGAVGRPHRLCTVYRAADLTPQQVLRLQAAESGHAGAVFVAYAKPLIRWDDPAALGSSKPPLT